MQKARGQFNEEALEWFWKFGYLDPLPAELEHAKEPRTGKNLREYEENREMNKIKMTNACERAEREFVNRDLFLNITDMPHTHIGGDISHIYCVMIRKSQEIYQACDQQVKTRVKPYDQALQAFFSVTDKKISALFHQICDELNKKLLAN